MITLSYYGPLKDALGCAHESYPWTGGLSTAQLLAQLRARGEPWHSALAAHRVFKMAVNHELLHHDALIPKGAHVGIVPPVTGG